MAMTVPFLGYLRCRLSPDCKRVTQIHKALRPCSILFHADWIHIRFKVP